MPRQADLFIVKFMEAGGNYPASEFRAPGWLHSAVESAIDEYNRQLAVTEEEMQWRALESVQNTRLKALEDSREKIQKLSQRE